MLDHRTVHHRARPAAPTPTRSSATSAPGSPGSARSPSSPSSSLQNVVRGGSAPANGASDRRGARALRRPPRRSPSCSSPRSWSAGPASPSSSAARCAACSPATARLGLHGLRRRHRRSWCCSPSSSVPSRRCRSSPHGDQPDPGAVDALWALHNSVFTVLYLLHRRRAARPLPRRRRRRHHPAGVPAPRPGRLRPARRRRRRRARRSRPATPWPCSAVGGVGFLIWLAFLVTTGIRLVRSESPS